MQYDLALIHAPSVYDFRDRDDVLFAYLSNSDSVHVSPRGFDVEGGLGVLAHLDPDLVEKIEGVDATDGYGAVHHVLRTGVRELEGEVRAEVDRLYGAARESLRVVWPSVQRVAKALLEREELHRAELDEALADDDLFGPVFAVQRAHGLLPAAPPPLR